MKDINNNPLTIGKCYKNIGNYVKQTLNIKDDTYLGELNEIIGEYGSSDPRFAGRNKIYIFENNLKMDEYFIKKQNIKFKEVSCDDFHSELPTYALNGQLQRTLSLTQPPEYEAYELPKKYEAPPAYVKQNTLNTLGNTIGNTLGNTLNNTFTRLTRLTRGKSPPYTESGGKKNKKKSRKTKKRKNKKTSKRRTSKRKSTRKH
jgi:hypothetical protein